VGATSEAGFIWTDLGTKLWRNLPQNRCEDVHEWDTSGPLNCTFGQGEQREPRYVAHNPYVAVRILSPATSINGPLEDLSVGLFYGQLGMDL